MMMQGCDFSVLRSCDLFLEQMCVLERRNIIACLMLFTSLMPQKAYELTYKAIWKERGLFAWVLQIVFIILCFALDRF